MNIANTIARCRKAKGLTQEALGALVGVSNQAVSKWENGSTAPDIAIIPTLANALGVSLDEFFGVQKNDPSSPVPADDLPAEVFRRIYQSFTTLWRLPSLDEAAADFFGHGWRLSCVSNTSGYVTQAEGFGYVDMSFKTPEGGACFENDYAARAAVKLFQKNVRRVLKYEYDFMTARNDYVSDDTGHTPAEIAAATGLSEEEILDALDTLVALEINCTDGVSGVYYISYGYFPDLFALFNAAKLATCRHTWHRVRDTMVVSDNIRYH